VWDPAEGRRVSASSPAGPGAGAEIATAGEAATAGEPAAGGEPGPA
jgi:hypothetical protein